MRADLPAFLATLSTRDWRKLLPDDIDKIDRFIGSDGCTMALQVYRQACVLHDFWYRTHVDFTLTPLRRGTADKRFRQLMQAQSDFGPLSPMAWWRWAAVRLFARKAWTHEA